MIPSVENCVVPRLLHSDDRLRLASEAANHIRRKIHELLGGGADEKVIASDRKAIGDQTLSQNLNQLFDRINRLILQVTVTHIVERGQPVPLDELQRQ
jgi:hypothetical protein